MPRLWEGSVEAHRRAVREAILAATSTLLSAHGLRAVTMSRIAREAGIGRATLYKYFADVDEVLLAWHERQVGGHVEQLATLRDGPGDAGERLQAVLETYALIQHQRVRHEREGGRLATLMHRAEHLTNAEQHLRDLVRDLLAEGARSGSLRGDVAPGELAGFCLHALAAARDLDSEAAVRRLVAVTLDGLRRPP